MRTFHLMIDCFADIMQKTGAFCKADIKSELAGQKTG